MQNASDTPAGQERPEATVEGDPLKIAPAASDAVSAGHPPPRRRDTYRPSIHM
jgi:hypothetical protein